MKTLFALGSLVLLFGCSEEATNQQNTNLTDGGTGGGPSSGGGSNGGSSTSGGSSNAGRSNGGNATSGGSTGNGGNTGNGGSAGNTGNGGSGGASTAGPWNAGNPDGSCGSGVPAEGQPADTNNPDHVVGNGTAASCTFDALNTAVQAGGVITFDCGTSPVTIAITATLEVPWDHDTVIDGNRLVTLDGQGSVRIMRFWSDNWQNSEHRLTLQHVALVNGKATPTERIPTAPAPCSQGWNDGEGGALLVRDGNVTVIDSIFTGNRAADEGPDTGGGAIYIEGSKHGDVIVGSTFTDNQASNAGALGGLFCEHHIYNSLFSDNKAVGHDANNNEPSKCSAMNNGQNETGSGGNGGAIYSDGIDVNILICGAKIVNNTAGTNAFGAGVFFTSNNFAGTLTFADTTMTGNTGRHWTSVKSGSVTDVGTAVGTNCQSITITNSTIQGVNGVP